MSDVDSPDRIVDEALRADPVVGWATETDGMARVVIDTARRTLVITVGEMLRYRISRWAIDDIVYRAIRELGEQAAADAQKRDREMTLAIVEQMRSTPRVNVNDLISPTAPRSE